MERGPEFTVPETVIEDTKKYQNLVEDFISGNIDSEHFKGYRVPMGIYGQRSKENQDLYMIRVRIPGGVLRKNQLKVLNDIAHDYGGSFLHFTTRQDIQIHRVKIEDTPEILYELLEVGLSPRGGGGNTVRNILNSPQAGVNSEEAFDTTPHALALSEYLLQDRSSFNLPRKYKIAFSSSPVDDALATVNDLGFIAKYKKGKKGFKVYGAGGMGNNAKTAIVINDFIQERNVFHTAEAIKRLFDKYGDRTNKHKARLRFVRERLGDVEFNEKYKGYLAEVNSEELRVKEIKFYKNNIQDFTTPDKTKQQLEELLEQDFLYQQKNEGYYSLELNPVNGDITYTEIKAILKSINNLEVNSKLPISLRTTLRQGLLLRNIRADKVKGLIYSINNINKNLLVSAEATLPIACKGASTCRLGLCLSNELALAIQKTLLSMDYKLSSLLPQIHISGCPNSCGQHLIAPIGFEGKARRYQGRLVPHYALALGGITGDGKAQLAEKVIDIPARRIPDFITALAEHFAVDSLYQNKSFFYEYLQNGGREKIKNIASQFTEIASYEEEPELYRDWGQQGDFDLKGRGPGECGTGIMDIIKLDLDTARGKLDSCENEDLYQAIINTARALLVIKGIDSNKDRVIIQQFKEKFLDDYLVATKYGKVLDAALDFKLGDEDALNQYKNQIKQLYQRIVYLYNSLNAKLEFVIDEENNDRKDGKDNRTQKGINKNKDNIQAENEEKKTDKYVKDLRGVKCPLNFVKAKLFIEPLPRGTIVDLYLDQGDPIKNVPDSLVAEGHEILKKEQTAAGYYHLKVKKG